MGEDNSSELRVLVDRAENGDCEALERLKADYADRVAPYLQKTGDLAARVQGHLIHTAAGKNLVLQEALESRILQMKRDLAGPDPSPLESILVERVTACWLQMCHAEGVYVQNLKKLKNPKADAFFQRRLDHTHRRLLSAIKALAQVRKMGIPAVQVNIGQHQVNVADQRQQRPR